MSCWNASSKYFCLSFSFACCACSISKTFWACSASNSASMKKRERETVRMSLRPSLHDTIQTEEMSNDMPTRLSGTVPSVRAECCVPYCLLPVAITAPALCSEQKDKAADELKQFCTEISSSCREQKAEYRLRMCECVSVCSLCVLDCASLSALSPTGRELTPLNGRKCAFVTKVASSLFCV